MTKPGARTLLLLLLASTTPALVAQAADPQVQVFVEVVGSSPEWVQLDLSVARIEVGGLDAVTGKRFLVRTSAAGQTLMVPRAAEGAPRFLASAAARAGAVDRVYVYLNSSSLTTEPPDAGSSPKVVPLAVQDNALKLRPAEPFPVTAGETRSVLVTIELGKDAVLTRKNVLALSPSYLADLYAPAGPENYLNGDEILVRGPDTALPELGIQVSRSKAVDTVTGAVRDVNLRSDSNAAVSYSGLRDEEESLWRTRHGALSRSFVERLSTVATDDAVAATVLVRTPGPATFETDADTPQSWRAAHAAFVAEREATAAPVMSSLADALVSAGATIVDSSLDPAMFSITATREVLESIAADLENVVRILGTPDEGSVLTTNAAEDLISFPLQTTGGGGSGLLVALMDVKPCVDTEHEAFVNMQIENPVAGCDPSVGPTAALESAGHSTAVAGALGATVPETFDGDPYHMGAHARPPAGESGVSRARVIGYDSCIGAPIDRSPHLGSISCIQASLGQGPDTILREYLDDAVYGHRIFLANGSGNIGSGYLVGEYRESAFCNSYNSVCVGGYHHKRTVGTGKFADDEPYGGWRNFDGREKPDLIGPACSTLPDATPDVIQLEHKDWSSQRCGTSFATPSVVGVAGLLMASYQDELVGDPTLTRAVLMASASHALPGHARVPNYSDDVDDRGGAGAPRGDRAKAIMDSGTYLSKFVDRTTDFDSAGYLKAPISFEMQENDRARIVLTYDQCQVGTNSVADGLFADLDLVATENALHPALQVHANNSHLDNTEILEFSVPAGAQVHVSVRVQFWNPCADGRKTHMAVAWDVQPGQPPVIGP